MFTRVLIANRGEIACRIMATCQRLGVQTVAVYSDADADSLHVEMADVAVRIGPASVAESYLRGDVIIQAALDAGADAIHPGYGFLSENAEFGEAVVSAGLGFVGPSPDAIRAMGLKDAAKALMQKADVPVVPGYHGAEQDADVLAAEAEKIGYPVLIKARAGGGGKGMRLVEQPSDFKTSLEAAQREGSASFGDPHCLIEKYITRPRHIEVQVFGDAHGNVVHLFERDCSLQRRHQKVIEEAPAPDMTESLRAAMGRAAVAAAKAINYSGAGTVEFIVDGTPPLRDDGFWFMEMNTRLQVEHPVTEAITGLDLVELQLRVAFGEPLPFTQSDLTIDGWSVEARLYAEDVPKGFLPAAGRLSHLAFPQAGAFQNAYARVDTGVRSGDEVSPHYDPMIAKVIAHGPDRTAAFAKLRQMLAQTEVGGLVTNRDFLIALVSDDDVLAGRVETGLIGAKDILTSGVDPMPAHWAVAAIANDIETRGSDPFDRLKAFSIGGPLLQSVTLECGEGIQTCQVETIGPDQWQVDGIALRRATNGDYLVRNDAISHRFKAVTEGRRITVFDGARTYDFNRVDPLQRADLDEASGDTVSAPMTGVAKLVSVKVGDVVSKGQPLLVLEAMKMEHSLTAPRDGVVTQVAVTEGTQVGDGTVLIALEPLDG